MANRRDFIKRSLLGSLAFLPSVSAAVSPADHTLLLPPRLKENDLIGLVAPASALFESHRTLIEANEKMKNLGFRTRPGKHIFSKKGYLAGSVEERVEDLHDLFIDEEVRAIVALRGGYGSGQLLPYLDYNLIRKHPKILVGYSDITSLLLGIHKMTGLVTFHGPVAISTFTDYTRKYFLKILMEAAPAGPIDDAPYEKNLQTSNRIWTVNSGKERGRLTGGNLTLMVSTLGTPFEIETDNRIVFIEEIGEEPYDLDRMLNHLKQAGKFEKCRGVFFDGMKDVKPSSVRPSFNSTLSVEEVITQVFSDYRFPVCVGISIGHIKDKPTLPLGIQAELDADTGRIALLEQAVV